MVSSLGQAAALAALADADHLRRSIENNAAEEKLLTKAITEMGISVVPTWTNFLFCRVGEEAPGLCERLQQEGVIVRSMGPPWAAPDAFRVTIGTPEQNRRFLGALKRAVSQVTA